MSAQEANWQAMFAPAATPESVIKSLNDALEGVVNDLEVLKNSADTESRPIRRQIARRRPEAPFFTQRSIAGAI